MNFSRLGTTLFICFVFPIKVWGLEKKSFCLKRIVSFLQSSYLPLEIEGAVSADARALQLKQEWNDLPSVPEARVASRTQSLTEATEDFFESRAEITLVWQKNLGSFLVQPTQGSPFEVWLFEMRRLTGVEFNVYLLPPTRTVVENDLTKQVMLQGQTDLLFPLGLALDHITSNRQGESAFILNLANGLFFMTHYVLGLMDRPQILRPIGERNDSLEGLVIQKALIGRLYTEVEKYAKKDSLTDNEKNEVRVLFKNISVALHSFGETSERLQQEFDLLRASYRDLYGRKFNIETEENVVVLKGEGASNFSVAVNGSPSIYGGTIGSKFVFEFDEEGTLKTAAHWVIVQDEKNGERTTRFPLAIDSSDVDYGLKKSDFAHGKLNPDAAPKLGKLVSDLRSLLVQHVIRGQAESVDALNRANQLATDYNNMVNDLSSVDGDLLPSLKRFVESWKPVIRNYPF